MNRLWIAGLALAALAALAACDTSEDGGNAGANNGQDAGADVVTDAQGDAGAEADTEPDPEDTSDTAVDAEPDTGEDVPEMDAEDASDADAAEEDAADTTDEPDLPPQGELTAEILTPTARDVVEVGMPVTFTGQVTDTIYAPEDLSVRWVSDIQGELHAGGVDENGMTSFTAADLQIGWHVVTLFVDNPAEQTDAAQVRFGICDWGVPETFDTEIDGDSWRIYGDATWDDGGWLEMTGNFQDRKGAIYNIADVVNPGDVSISFRIWTGGGTGADGFAMSVFDAVTVERLDELNAAAGDGGALGYGVGGAWGDWEIDAFHVEFDTWHNVFNGDNEFHTDPTPENHIGVMTNGDPGTHHLWAEIPTIEDQQWHDVTVQVTGDRVIVTLDAAVIIDGQVPGLNFKGGFIGFSGTTGFFTNFHRFDQLQVLQECLVP